MRCSSTVSAPVQHCCAPLTAHHSRYIAVQLLTNQVLYFVTETKSKTKDVYAQTCVYLAGQGMLDCELFGLAIMYDGEYLFVDPESKLSKYAPKNWKSSSTHGLDAHGKPVFVLHFRVQFYVDTAFFLRDDITRHNYYLQLRDNALSRGQVTFCSSDELLLLLAGYALQADYGDYNESEHKSDYFQIDKYFPKELITRNSQVMKTAIALHKDNRGLTTAEAEMQYIKEASSNEITMLTHNLHLYKLKSHKKQEVNQTTVWLAICSRGIQIYEETQYKKSPPTTFLWNNIGKLCFDRKKFEIKALSTASKKLTYYTSSDEKSKLLLFLCRVTHQFTMSLQAKLSEVKKREEEEERKSYRNSFAYGRGVLSNLSTLTKANRAESDYKTLRSDQRISVISNTSSNTTSGIVSDRVQSLDESEDDLEIEIMINSPPGNSVESLALAHLRDETRSVETPVDVSVPKSGEVADSFVPGDGASVQKSSHAVGGGPATPATTDGSQCSSSCSTVVVVGPGANSSSLSLSSGAGRPHNSHRRGSTTSSLELGYSHTAQNSVVSDSVSCLEIDVSGQSSQFGLTGQTECDNCDEIDGCVVPKSSPKNGLVTSDISNFILGKINQIGASNGSFGRETAATGTDSSSSGNFDVSASDVFGPSDMENTQQSEMDFTNLTETHLSNASDLDTTSSGIYTNSNDLISSRLYSSTDLEMASSGIFTLPSGTEADLHTNACSSETSGIYGVVNSMADTSSASECCGAYAVMEPMRERTGSNASAVSASRSFHGDGSDPSEARMGTLLSAEELSDLIVGKAHNSGTYPSRATVSHTLDSDSDYVTLPPPPRLPPRNDLQRQLASSLSDVLDKEYLESERMRAQVSSPNLLVRPEAMQQNYLNGVRHHVIADYPVQANCHPVPIEQQQQRNAYPHRLEQIHSGCQLPVATEEANARFITTKPHISMITHSNVPSSSHMPNFACPTHLGFNVNYDEINSSADVVSANLNGLSPVPRYCVRNIDNIAGCGLSFGQIQPKIDSAKCLQLNLTGKTHANSMSVLPVVGKNNYLDVHASRANNYVPPRTVTYPRTFSPQPQLASSYPRQLSPPQSPLATVYTSQVTSSQIEQFKQQLYSDVDYVIYPMKDPAISKQEYMDAKQGSLLAAMAAGYPHLYPPPPPYPCSKTHAMYRSAPNVAVGSAYLPLSLTKPHLTDKYSSHSHLNRSTEQLSSYKTNLTQPHGYSSSKISPIYSPASYSSNSSHSLLYDSVNFSDYFIPHSLSTIPGNFLNFSRTKSDDNILNSSQNYSSTCFPDTKYRRCPPPPPRFPQETRRPVPAATTTTTTAATTREVKGQQSSTAKFRGSVPPVRSAGKTPESANDASSSSTKTMITNDKGKIIDIHALIEKSKNLDLPLISALCNDKSLIRQTNAFVMPKHPGGSGNYDVGSSSSGSGQPSKIPAFASKKSQKERTYSFAVDNRSLPSSDKQHKRVQPNDPADSLTVPAVKSTKSASLLETLFSVKTSKKYANSSKLKYPVSGLSTTQISKPHKKLSSAHVHPRDGKNGHHVGPVKIQSKTASAIKNNDALVP